MKMEEGTCTQGLEGEIWKGRGGGGSKGFKESAFLPSKTMHQKFLMLIRSLILVMIITTHTRYMQEPESGDAHGTINTVLFKEVICLV